MLLPTPTSRQPIRSVREPQRMEITCVKVQSWR